MITIQHTHTDAVTILYYYSDITGDYILKEKRCGTMDDLAEHVCALMIRHNFNYADVCSDSTGEVLVTIRRT